MNDALETQSIYSYIQDEDIPEIDTLKTGGKGKDHDQLDTVCRR